MCKTQIKKRPTTHILGVGGDLACLKAITNKTSRVVLQMHVFLFSCQQHGYFMKARPKR